jgi:hypothetical protein
MFPASSPMLSLTIPVSTGKLPHSLHAAGGEALGQFKRIGAGLSRNL